MTLILKESTDSATVAGITLTGPFHGTVDGATIASVEYAKGVVMVQGGTATQIAAMTEAGQWSIPLSMVGGLLLGLFAARQWVLRSFIAWFLLANVALADFHRVQETVQNQNPESRTYRATIWNLETTGGTAQWTVAAKTGAFDGSSAGTYYVRLAVRQTVANTWVWATAAETRTKAAGSISISVPEVVYTTVAINNATWCKWFSFQSEPTPTTAATNATWQCFFPREQTPTAGTSASVTVRDEIVDQWQFELAAHSSLALDMQYAFPFELAVDELTQVGTPDGGYAFAYEEIVAQPSTLHTSGDSPNPTTTPQGPDYEPPETPDVPATTPPNAVADTTQKADQNEAARDNDEKTLLGQIRDGVATGVNTTAGAAAQANANAAAIAGAIDALGGEGLDGGVGTDETSKVEAATADGEAKSEGLVDAVEELSDAVEDVAGVWTLNVASASFPVLEFEKPAGLGGGIVTMNFATYSSWFGLLRLILLLACVWGFLTGCLATVREAVS